MEESIRAIYQLVTLGTLSFLIVLSNVVVVALVCINKKLRSYTNWLILSLVVSDILTGGILFLVTFIKPGSIVEGYFTTLILTSGVVNISAVTFDRYVAVMKPLQYSYLVSKLFKRGIVILWLIPTIYASVPLLWGADPTQTVHKVYLVCLEFLGIVVPYIFITVAYIRIFKQVRRSLALRKHLKSMSKQINERRRISSDAQVAKVFFIVSLAFLFSWMPILYMTTTAYILNRFDIVPDVLPTVSLFTIAMGSLVNPLVYAFLKPDFKMTIRNFCQKGPRRCVNKRVEFFPVFSSENKEQHETSGCTG